MKKPDEDIALKLAQAIAGDAQVDWSSLGVDPSSLEGRLENLRRLSRVASSFERHFRTSGVPAPAGPAGAPGSGGPDSGGSDPGAPDSGRPDTGVPDSGRPNTGGLGSGGPGSGRPDSGEPDAGVPDSGEPTVGEAGFAGGESLPGADQSGTPGAGLAPTRWGSLEIVGFLGEGAFGAVYLAFDPMLEREVALKLWRRGEDSVGSPRQRERQIRRLLEEARRMARIRHPNVVVVHGADIHDGRVGIWSERLSGETLAVRLQREGPLRTVEVTRLGAQIADALAAVHAAGLVHGDVKEANVVLEESGRVVLFDFGSGRRLEDPTSIEPLASTPFYVSPEVLLDGAELSPQTDIYALGVLLHRLVTGLYPLEAETLGQLLELHRARRIGVRRGAPSAQAGVSTDPIGDAARSTVTDDLRTLIERAVDPDPARRPPSVREVARELRFLAERASEQEIPTSLPEPTTPLFGRDAEIGSVQEQIRSARLLTLTGVGGAGKSRLALASVRPLTSEFSDGVFWIPLAPLRSGQEIVSAVLAAMGMSDRVSGGVRDLVLRLATRRLLLVLDNAEHLAESVRALVEEIVTGTESVCVLVTSRRALGGASEELFRVAPLAVPMEGGDSFLEALAPASAGLAPSVALFADRARRRDPDFDLAHSRAAVERICRRLEGIPLAIEIAAARAAALSPEEIAEQLDLPLDVGADAGARPQHRSLRTSMAWSHDLLPPEAREALRRLSVFADGWSTGAAIAVVARPEFVVRESMATLYEHSLIERRRDASGRVRFSMLETVRGFADEQLVAAGEAEETAARHSEHYRERFRSEAGWLGTCSYAAVLSRLEPESANLERSLAFSLKEGRADSWLAEEHALLVLDAIGFWHLSGRDAVAVRHLSEAIEIHGTQLPGRLRGRLHLARGRFFYLRGFSSAEEDLLRASTLLEGVDRIGWAKSEASIGAAVTAQLRFPEAEARILGALRELEAGDDPAALCMGLRQLADLRFKEGRMEDAAAALDRAEPIARQLGDPIALAMLLVVRASLAWARGDLEVSLEIHQQCLDETAGAPLLPARSLCQTNLGTIRWALGDPAAARRHWELSERLSRRWGEDVRRATNLINLVEYYPLEKRSRILFEAFETFVRFDHLRYCVLALSELGAHYLDLGRVDLGIQLLAAAEEIRDSRGVSFPEPIAAGLSATVERAREALPAGTFDELWSGGGRISLEEARALIETDLRRLPGGDFPAGESWGSP